MTFSAEFKRFRKYKSKTAMPYLEQKNIRLCNLKYWYDQVNDPLQFNYVITSGYFTTLGYYLKQISAVT